MNCVMKLFIYGNTVHVYEQCMNDDYSYTAYLITGKKKYFLDDFDSLTEAFNYCLQYCYDH